MRPVSDDDVDELLRHLPAEASRAAEADGLIGTSVAIRSVRALVDRIAPLDASVLLTGESGTGKGLVARRLHQRGGAGGAFVPINCGAIPVHLLESELFGHARGAFTGATRPRTGLLEEADGGVVFLDEIDALPLALQAKLLRVLDQRVIRPLGANQERPFDARVVAASNADLPREVTNGHFRKDLYFRLKVLRIHLPPLRERGHDILLLAQVFLTRAAAKMGRAVEGLTPEAAVALLEHDWPGNVRELDNCITRAVALSPYHLLTPATLELRTGEPQQPPFAVELESLVPLDVMELSYVAAVMASVSGDVVRAAAVLGVSPRTLGQRLRRMGLEGHGAPERLEDTRD